MTPTWQSNGGISLRRDNALRESARKPRFDDDACTATVILFLDPKRVSSLPTLEPARRPCLAVPSTARQQK